MRRIQLCAVLFTFAGAGLAHPSIAAAQCTANGAPANCNVPGSVSMTAGRVVRVQVSAGSTALSTPTPSDFDAGFNSTTGPSLTVSANAAWTLHVRASTAVWAATNTSAGAPARTTKPAGDLKWSTAANGTFNALTTSDVLLVGGSATASTATTLYFQTLYGWTLDTPGNYSVSVVLTLTSP
ncbi:MAG: hypothetical protein QOD47_1481 [Gemmatimonadaceae bacterium]|nr:hypothetical protein [Gemmatimonadaceae bacterium]